jgi:hypothetical protein
VSPPAFLIFLAMRFSLMDFAAFFRVGLLTDFSDMPLLQIAARPRSLFGGDRLRGSSRAVLVSFPAPPGQDAPQGTSCLSAVVTKPYPNFDDWSAQRRNIFRWRPTLSRQFGNQLRTASVTTMLPAVTGKNGTSASSHPSSSGRLW